MSFVPDNRDRREVFQVVVFCLLCVGRRRGLIERSFGICYGGGFCSTRACIGRRGCLVWGLMELAVMGELGVSMRQ